MIDVGKHFSFNSATSWDLSLFVLMSMLAVSMWNLRVCVGSLAPVPPHGSVLLSIAVVGQVGRSGSYGRIPSL